MTTRVGPTQQVVLLCLMDGTSRTAARVDEDMLLTPGRAAGALRGLYARGLVQPQRTGVFHGTEWTLTDAGTQLADQLHPAPEDVPLCAHGVPTDGPCRDCRTGPWRCSACGEVVPGGRRGPHRREVHDDWRSRTAFTWAGVEP